MKKTIQDLRIVSRELLGNNFVLLKMSPADGSKLPEMVPGQFAELKVDNSTTTFLRRPISINYVDIDKNQVWFLIQMIGDGTRKLGTLTEGDIINVIFPLGNCFNRDLKSGTNVLLVGGGVGTAPMLFLGSELKKQGVNVYYLLGARNIDALLQIEDFKSTGTLYTTTEDGSHGEKGFVTNHSILNNIDFDFIYTCGPKPMMKAVANYARSKNIDCEVSLENTMACGIGVCLCCVENTKEGHKCVCSEGPIFNIKELLWQD